MRACRAGGQLILLDLQRGRYLSLSGLQAHDVGALFCERSTPQAHPVTNPGRRTQQAIDRLRAQGLLVDGPSVTPQTIAYAEASASLDLGPVPLRSIRLSELASFVVSLARGKAWLRWRSLYSIVNLIEARRQGSARFSQDASRESVERLLGVYGALQPLAFSAHGQCLLDSLVLLEFLHRSGCHAQWFIGIRTSPFRAHAWLQLHGTVLNDRFENVRRFEPILVVCQ
jgi:hypothetical protein